jgi:hypothetical protein
MSMASSVGKSDGMSRNLVYVGPGRKLRIALPDTPRISGQQLQRQGVVTSAPVHENRMMV